MIRALSTIVLLFALSAASAQAQNPISPEESAEAAAVLGVPADRIADLEVRTVPFPALGMRVTVIKAIDRTTGEVLSSVRDLTGSPVDLTAVLSAEKDARARRASR